MDISAKKNALQNFKIAIFGLMLCCTLTNLFSSTAYTERMMPLCHDGRFYYNQEEYESGTLWKPYIGILYKIPALIARELPHALGIKRQPLCDWPTAQEPTFPARSKKPVITWINQSSFLIQIGNTNILLDPVFSDCSPLRRTHKPGFHWELLPKIDYILISHNHKDHTDFEFLQKITERDNPTCIVPVGNGVLFASYGITNNIEANWWDQLQYPKGKRKTSLAITCLPARHWSCRQLSDANKALWSSWMIESNGYTIYYAGDSGSGDHFAQIADQFPRIDAAIIPIHPIKSSHEHIGPKDAIAAFLELKANIFIPAHWGTFSCESYPGERPIQRLIQHWQLRSEELANKSCLIYEFGETKNISGILKEQKKGRFGLIGITEKLSLLENIIPSTNSENIDDEEPAQE